MSPLYRRVGHYEIRSEIGGGGMADVYVAEDDRDGRTVALKIPRRDPEIRRAERQGALLQRHLAERDARVAQVYESGEDEGVPFVAMEYVAGQDLSERIAVGPLPPEEAIRIAIELCDLLSVAHACTPAIEGGPRRGIVHGDLKPRNIRLDLEGRVRVVDFGIAKALSETRRLTQNEFGSLAYASPERVDTGTVDAHADLWAVGVVLYEMLTGVPPFRAATPRQLEELLLGRTRPASLPASCPPALDAVLRKAFAPALQERYAGAAELKADLECVLAGTPTAAEIERAAHNGAPASAVLDGAHASNGARHDSDAEVTRRSTTSAPAPGDEVTRRSPRDSEVTRRTANPSGPAVAPPLPSGTAMAPASVPSAPGARRVSWRTVKRVLVVAAILAIVNEALVIRAAGELATRLPALGRAEGNQAWHDYQRLQNRSLLRVGLWGVRGRLASWNMAQSDELTSDYLSDTPTIRERGWLQAKALLTRAVQLSPGDSKARARLLYCQGQLARIDGEALLERNQAAAARARFNQARRDFEEAARLRGRWPDPYLGLARVHAIAFADVDRAEEALGKAERAGYQRGDREVALLADAHRLRAERMLVAVPGLPDEGRYLDRIREECFKALDLYDQVPAYGQVSRSIRSVHALLERVDDRQSAPPSDSGSAEPLSPVPGYQREAGAGTAPASEPADQALE